MRRSSLLSSTSFLALAAMGAETGAGSGHTKEELDSLTEEERKGLLDADVVDDPPPADGAKAAADAATEGKTEGAKVEADKVKALDETSKLTPAEIEAAADAAIAAVTGKKADTGKKDADDRDQVDKDADAEAAKAAATAAAAAAAKAGKTDDDKKGAAEVEIADRSSVPAWTPPADSEKKLGDIATKKAALVEKFDSGDLSAKEFQAGIDGLATEEREIRESNLKAQMGHDMRVASWQNETVADFLDEHPQYNSNDTLNRALDREVRQLQVQATEAGKNPFSPKILEQAHHNIAEAVGALLGKKPEATAPAPKDGDKGKKVETRERPAIPPTLARVPAAEATETSDTRFAALDKLADANPEAFQIAMAKLPDDVREAYLAATH